MALLQVRDVPTKAHETLKARAASRGISLNRYMLDLIDREVARPTVAEVLERAAARPGRVTGSEVVDAIHAAREERDRELFGE